ncbi:bursicon [Caerostris extrusa]|uniref:Bursicon n=1 Tax=Caerostris extrusa TaxID=172846 RepID=A0AAV4XR24_CAEEX|nr:bursicon [Caerostris extrusa]
MDLKLRALLDTCCFICLLVFLGCLIFMPSVDGRGEECHLRPVIHVLQQPGCIPKPIPSFACQGSCSSYVQKSHKVESEAPLSALGTERYKSVSKFYCWARGDKGLIFQFSTLGPIFSSFSPQLSPPSLVADWPALLAFGPTGFKFVSGSKFWQVERSCMCCQEMGEREANIGIFCPKASPRFRKIVTRAPVECMCRPCTAVDEAAIQPQEMSFDRCRTASRFFQRHVSDGRLPYSQ